MDVASARSCNANELLAPPVAIKTQRTQDHNTLWRPSCESRVYIPDSTSQCVALNPCYHAQQSRTFCATRQWTLRLPSNAVFCAMPVHSSRSSIKTKGMFHLGRGGGSISRIMLVPNKRTRGRLHDICFFRMLLPFVTVTEIYEQQGGGKDKVE